MSKFKIKSKFCNGRGLTLIEILIVVSLMAMISLALYNAFNNGLKIWKLSQRLVVEEDIAIFFDKISQDLRNAYLHSKITFDGTEQRFAFPTIVRVIAPANPTLYQDQLGRVEYFYDAAERKLYRKQATYGQALGETFEDPQLIAKSIDQVRFRYIYLTQQEPKYSEQVLETIPSAVDVEVEFSDTKNRHLLHKLILIPIGS